MSSIHPMPMPVLSQKYERRARRPSREFFSEKKLPTVGNGIGPIGPIGSDAVGDDGDGGNPFEEGELMTALEALALARAEGYRGQSRRRPVPISAIDRAAKRPLTCSRPRRQTRDRRAAALARPLHPPRARACPQFPRSDGERRQRPHPARERLKKLGYEWRDDSSNWFRSYGNENWEFDKHGPKEVAPEF